MKPEKKLEELLQWRLTQARAEAPAAPSTSQLLQLARPWWEKSPEMLLSRVERLSRIKAERDHAAAEANRSDTGYGVPALIVRGAEESEGFARVLEFRIRNDNLRFRFRLEPPLPNEEPTLELTFISDTSARPVLVAEAIALMESDCLANTVVPPEIARDWSHLKETDYLPFRLILRYGISPDRRCN